jgi:sugar phosphate isomerase/epimerase
MNIEEYSFEKAIHDSREHLSHMHFADNNRSMPGFAHVDFEPIVRTLQKISYDRFVSFEPNFMEYDYKSATLEGLQHIKKIENNQS